MFFVCVFLCYVETLSFFVVSRCLKISLICENVNKKLTKEINVTWIHSLIFIFPIHISISMMTNGHMSMCHKKNRYSWLKGYRGLYSCPE